MQVLHNPVAADIKQYYPSNNNCETNKITPMPHSLIPVNNSVNKDSGQAAPGRAV
ncbi:hypothetical protein B7P43_G00789 [Cryptotermes secundus]|uniref:Uncharacterized protein n=1 Tax=Cryptotermes secundus TaxID=105785 RepID=A0A2J7QSI4_9NEOP|nr:hypothetical protein B7P43_G00789 [Cryptotermes secundus]